LGGRGGAPLLDAGDVSLKIAEADRDVAEPLIEPPAHPGGEDLAPVRRQGQIVRAGHARHVERRLCATGARRRSRKDQRGTEPRSFVLFHGQPPVVCVQTWNCLPWTGTDRVGPRSNAATTAAAMRGAPTARAYPPSSPGSQVASGGHRNTSASTASPNHT